MMKKVLKWIGIVLGTLVGLVVLAAAVVYFMTQARVNRTYNIQVEAVAIPTDAASIARGQHVVVTRLCDDCHGTDLAGRVFLDDPVVGRIITTNLTSGKGGVGSQFGEADWVRAIRHGVAPDGKPLLVMPAGEFYFLSDADLGAAIAYLRSLPPVDNILPTNVVGPLFRVAMTFMDVVTLPAESIDHTAARPIAPEAGVTVAYGGYLTTTCTGCHGPGFSGGPIPMAPPDFPPAVNLTPGGEVAGWTEEMFINTLRTGVTPGGHQMDDAYMPWKRIGQMTDEELKAVFLFLRSLPAKEQGNR
jgi:mono/diheme cytochrome c family protein